MRVAVRRAIERLERDQLQPLERHRSALAHEAHLARAAGVEHDEAGDQPLPLVGRAAPRIVELVEDVGLDPAGAPLAVPRLRAAVDLDRHVVGMDLRGPPVEQDPALAAHGPGAGGQQPLGDASTIAPRYWLRACSPRSATWSDATRIASERSRAGSPGVAHVARTGSGTSPASRRHPRIPAFMTARASSRCVVVASASSPAARVTSGSAWMWA
jgi:hypothetical protein